MLGDRAWKNLICRNEIKKEKIEMSIRSDFAFFAIYISGMGPGQRNIYWSHFLCFTLIFNERWFNVYRWTWRNSHSLDTFFPHHVCLLFYLIVGFERKDEASDASLFVYDHKQTSEMEQSTLNGVYFAIKQTIEQIIELTTRGWDSTTFFLLFSE